MQLKKLFSGLPRGEKGEKKVDESHQSWHFCRLSAQKKGMCVLAVLPPQKLIVSLTSCRTAGQSLTTRPWLIPNELSCTRDPLPSPSAPAAGAVHLEGKEKEKKTVSRLHCPCHQSLKRWLLHQEPRLFCVLAPVRYRRGGWCAATAAVDFRPHSAVSRTFWCKKAGCTDWHDFLDQVQFIVASPP